MTVKKVKKYKTKVVKKHEAAKNNLVQSIQKTEAAVLAAKKEISSLNRQINHTTDVKAKTKLIRKRSQYEKKQSADNKRWDKLKSQLKKRNSTKKSAAKRKKANLKSIANKISKRRKNSRNEGTAAIYRTDGGTSEVMYISPSDQSEDNATDRTTYAVDKGAPVSDYARQSSKTITITGLISGEHPDGTGSMREANDKFHILRKWNANHNELTYRGSFYYQHLVITGLNRSYSNGYSYNFTATVTFSFAYYAEITTSRRKRSGKKTSKGRRAVTGNRTSRYSALTIKRGDTLWGLSKRYGKSVSWLRRVNHIKGDLIIAGKKIRVR